MKENIVVEKRGDTWKMIYPVYSDVNKKTFESLVEILQQGTIGKTISTDPNIYGAYAVDNSSGLRIDLVSSLGDSHSITIGKNIEGTMYAYVRDSAGIRKSNLPYDLFSSISSAGLRDKHLMNTPLESIQTIDVKNTTGSKQSLTRQGDTWNEDTIDELTSLLVTLINLNVESFHSRSDGTPYPEELRETYEYKLYLTLNDGNTETLYLKSVDNISYVYKEGAEEIAVIPPSFYEMLRELFL